MSVHLPDWAWRELKFWALQFLFWGTVTVVMVTIVRPGLRQQVPASTPIVLFAVIRASIAMFASAILRVIYRFPAFQTLRPAGLAVVTVAACSCMGLGYHLVITPAMAAWFPESADILAGFSGLFAVSWTVWLLLWSVGYHLATSFVLLSRAGERARVEAHLATEATLALRTSELERLSQQVEPHFLFNALTAVVASRHDPEAVADVTAALADYLRFCLSRSAKSEPLGRELDALQNLLIVHQARFGGAIDCKISGSPEARRVCVPPMVVAPMLDNALKFGNETSPKPLTIAIESRIDGASLEIKVHNSGSWVDATNAGGRMGTGLANLRRRLELAGIAGATVTTAPSDGGVTATVIIPMAADVRVDHATGDVGDADQPMAAMSPSGVVEPAS